VLASNVGRLAPLSERPILSLFADTVTGIVVVGGVTLTAATGIVVGETNAAIAGETGAGKGIVVDVGAAIAGQFVAAAISPEFEVAYPSE
jgi:hypothetical protein